MQTGSISPSLPQSYKNVLDTYDQPAWLTVVMPGLFGTAGCSTKKKQLSSAESRREVVVKEALIEALGTETSA